MRGVSRTKGAVALGRCEKGLRWDGDFRGGGSCSQRRRVSGSLRKGVAIWGVWLMAVMTERWRIGVMES